MKQWYVMGCLGGCCCGTVVHPGDRVYAGPFASASSAVAAIPEANYQRLLRLCGGEDALRAHYRALHDLPV